jgi:membrane protease YdiL (CAAX protease family)
MRLLAGLAAVFALFQWSATALGSDRGQAGLVVAALVVTALLIAERALFGESWRGALRSLGFGTPAARGMAAALAISAALLLVFPVYAFLTGVPVALVTPWLAIGLFAQAGIAEEALFRGYLFGRLRRTRPFWRAAIASMPPFVLVHLWLFATMDWTVALAAVLLSVVVSFPLARLFDLAGRTLWAPAIVHAVIQGAIKLIVIDGEPDLRFPLIWMTACAALPMLAFLIPEKNDS